MEECFIKKVGQWILHHQILCFVLFFGFVLRLMPILWGVPLYPHIKSYHPDEPKVYQTILRFPQIYLTSDPFPGYGTTIQYVLGILLIPLKLLADGDYYFVIMLIFSRFASVLIGTTTIYLTYGLAKKIFDKKTAILSALFISTSFYHVMGSSLITVDVAMSFFLVLNFILCFKAVEKNNFGFYIIFGITTGLMIGTKLTAGIFLIVPFTLILAKILTSQDKVIEMKTKIFNQCQFLFIYLTVALVVFCLFHPHIFLNFKKFSDFYIKEKLDWVDRTRGNLIDLFPLWIRKTSFAIGLPAVLCAFAGMIVAALKKNFRYAVMILFIVAYYAFWRWFMLPRYVIAVAPFLCIFAAYMCNILILKQNKVVKIAGMSCFLITLVFSIYYCVSGIYLRWNDTRPSAALYIEQNILPGTSIGIGVVSEKYNWNAHAQRYPRINFKKFKQTYFLERPEVLILSSADYEQILKAFRDYEFSDGYVLDKEYYKNWYRYSAPSARIFEFYDDLLLKNKTEYRLVKTFKIDVNVPIENPPPEIRIYRR